MNPDPQSLSSMLEHAQRRYNVNTFPTRPRFADGYGQLYAHGQGFRTPRSMSSAYTHQMGAVADYTPRPPVKFHDGSTSF